MVRAIFWALLAVFLCGCGGSSVGDVTGSVKLNDEPLGKVRLQFWAESDSSEPAGFGVTDEQGLFTLKSQQGKNLKPGSYVVVLNDMTSLESRFQGGKGSMPSIGPGPGGEIGDMPKPKPQRFKNDYSDRSKALIKVDLVSGKNELKPFEVEPNPQAAQDPN